MELTDPQLERYARHVVLPEIDEEGQLKLLGARVLVIGAGGLGSPLLLYLAAAGVGHIGVVDDDTVDLSNLQRQVVHDTSQVGSPKVESARARLKEINPEVVLEPHHLRIDPANAQGLVAGYDLVADGSDNFATRYLINDACYLARRTLVSAAIMRFDGQLSVFRAHRGHGEDGKANPCYRCLFREQPAADPKQSCADVGVLGALAGVMGSLQAIEVVKELLGIGRSMSGRLMLYDALESSFRSIKASADADCPLCGANPTIRSLQDADYGLSSAVCAAQ